MVPALGGSPCRATEGQDSLDHLGVARAPLEGLLGAHRVPDDQGHLFDDETLRYELVLSGDVVEDGDPRETRFVVGRRRVGRRGGVAVAEHVRHDDEVLVGVECHPLPYQPLVVRVPPAKPGWVDDRVGLAFVQGTVRLVSEPGTAQRSPSPQDYVPEFEDLVVRHVRGPPPK